MIELKEREKIKFIIPKIAVTDINDIADRVLNYAIAYPNLKVRLDSDEESFYIITEKRRNETSHID